MSRRHFYSNASHYERTLRNSAGLRVSPATLRDTTGGQHPGVAIFDDRPQAPALVITIDAAAERLADMLDAFLADHEKETAK